MSPEEDQTRDAVDSEPKHYQLSYSGPLMVYDFVWFGSVQKAMLTLVDKDALLQYNHHIANSLQQEHSFAMSVSEWYNRSPYLHGA